MDGGPRRISRACDACRLRKVRCNGQLRCQQCNHLDLKCIYSAEKVRKSKTALERGRLISQYKQSTASSPTHLLQLQPAPPKSVPSVPSPTVSVASQSQQSQPDDSPYDAAFFESLLPDYQASVYPVNPVVTETEVRDCIANMHADAERAAFVHAFAAVTLNLTRTGPNCPPDISNQIRDLFSRSIRLRGAMLPGEPITVRRIMISMFVHNCCMTLQYRDMAFFYMREAITQILMLQVDSRDAMAALETAERARRQRLYWEAFVHERFLAIIGSRPVILAPLPDLPELDPTIPFCVHEGFMQIIKLFRLVDGDFLSNWLGSTNPATPGLTPKWIENIHKELDKDELAGCSPESATVLTDMQQADLIITRQWLRTLVWQMAMSKCLLSSVSQKECMSLLFPVRLSSRLRALITTISRHDIEIHGSGILQKLFELTDTIADVVIHVPAATADQTVDRVDDFLFLLEFLFSFPRFNPVHKTILQRKLETLQALFPYVNRPPEKQTIPPAATAGPPLTLAQPGGESTPPWSHMARSLVPPGLDSPTASHPAMENVDPAAVGLSPDAYIDERWQHMTRKLSISSYE